MSPAASSSSPAATKAKTKASAEALTVNASPRPGSRMALEVTVPGGRSRASYETALETLGRSVRLPGFRKGRVPRPVLLQQIGPLRIRATALEDLVDGAFREALGQVEIAALGRPELSEGFETVLERFEPGEVLSFTLELDVQPTPTLRSTRGLKAEVETVSHDPARVDELIEQSRRQMATLVPVEGRAAASGDVAQVSFSGTFTDSGEPISGGSSDGMEVELEEGRMIPGFVEGILGMAVGESRTVRCSFPASYPQPEAAGREAEFAITLLELKTRELPPSMTPSPARPATRRPWPSCGPTSRPACATTPSDASAAGARRPCWRRWWPNWRWSCRKRSCSRRSATWWSRPPARSRSRGWMCASSSPRIWCAR